MGRGRIVATVQERKVVFQRSSFKTVGVKLNVGKVNKTMMKQKNAAKLKLSVR